MFRKEFMQVVTNTGMATLKELRRLTLNKNMNVITEFELLNYTSFDELKFAKVIAEKFSMTFIDLKNAKVADETLNIVNKRFVLRHRVLPIQITDQKATLAIFDPTVVKDMGVIGESLKRPVEFILTTISSWKKLFHRVEDSIDDLVKTIVEVKANETNNVEVKAEDISEDVITYVNKILAVAFQKKVSDIHFEPYEKNFRVRFRIDGSLVEYAAPPKNMMLPIVSRLKIMAEMDISEKRKPQDGRVKLSVGGAPIDYRVSSLPTIFGEKVCMRLLDSSNLQLDMTKLGMETKQIKVFKDAIHQPYGMCLVTGPTGSGKTTTLYSALADLNTPDVNISTAEDPVEFNLNGINQVNVRKDIGFTFSAALKSFLRQDPDVIMVGEIRDLEVGEIAVEAALTGHMVLSTLHTNDAPATVSRLLNMGIEPFLIVAALNVVVAQRLCRKICMNCREQVDVKIEDLVACGFAPGTAEKLKIYHGKGCDSCSGTGYRGRVAIHEVMEATPKLRDLILRNASSDELKRQAIRDGMKTLRMSALTKVAQGLTTLEEALSNSAADNL